MIVTTASAKNPNAIRGLELTSARHPAISSKLLGLAIISCQTTLPENTTRSCRHQTNDPPSKYRELSHHYPEADGPMPYLPAAESGNEGASTPAPSLSSISGPRNMTPVSWDVVSMAEQGSPSRSMPSSDVASPELNPMSQPETSTSAPGPTDDRRIGRHAQKICFVGAGFVG